MKRVVILFLVFSLFCFQVPVRATDISAKSAVLISADTGEILYSLNCDMRLPMASTTKIMTALLVCENGGLDKEVLIKKEMILVEGTSMGLSSGDRVTRKDLLYGMMLLSGNDAANALAVSVGGTYEHFVKLMNEKAEELGLKNTHFATPSGLDGDEHYTSAYDLAVITKKAFEYAEFSKTVATEKIILTYGNPPCRRQLINHNKLLRMYSDVVGVKTGYTSKSGRCLVSAAKKDNKFVIAVTLNDRNDWDDHRKLLDLGLSVLKPKNVSGYTISLPVVDAQRRLDITTRTKTLSVSKEKQLTERIIAPKFLYSPVKKGDIIGYTECFLDERRVLKENIISDVDINVKTDLLKEFFIVFSTILRSINEG